MWSKSFSVFLCSLIIGHVVPAHAKSITPVGYLPGGDYSVGKAISANGLSVVGVSNNGSGQEAFIWTKDGMRGLGFLNSDGFYSVANGISDDGKVAVGFSRDNTTREAFIWTLETGMVALGTLPGGANYSEANAVSANGTVVVGETSGVNGTEAFRWTAETGMVGLGDLPGWSFHSYATDVSADGNVVVGGSRSTLGLEAFRWTEAEGMVGLGDLAGGSFYSQASKISADGRVIVGTGTADRGDQAFRWTAETGMVGLGYIDQANDMSSYAYGVNKDGSVIVGTNYDASYQSLPFRWTEATGMQSIAKLLADAGVDLSDWQLFDATDVSADGNLIVGMASHQGNTVGYLANTATGGLTTPKDLSNSMQTIQQAGQQVAAIARNYAPNGLFIAQNIPQLSVPASTGGGVYGAQMSGGADSFANLSPASGGKAPSRLGAFLLGSVGIGHNNSSGNYQLNGTLGISMQVSDSWNIGAGMIAGRTRTDMDFNGDSRLDAVGGMTMASYVPYESPLRVFATAFAADLTLDNKRGYLNGSGLDYSRGDTGGFSYGGALRVGWEKELFSNETTMMPYIEGRYSKTKMDGYSERGGAFAASFSKQEDDYTASRLGIEFKHQLNEKLQVLFRPAWGHRFGGNGNGFTATTSGLTMGYAGQAGDRDWAEASVGASYHATDKLTFTTELTGRSGDTSEPLVSVTIGAFMKF